MPNFCRHRATASENIAIHFIGKIKRLIVIMQPRVINSTTHLTLDVLIHYVNDSHHETPTNCDYPLKIKCRLCIAVKRPQINTPTFILHEILYFCSLFSIEKVTIFAKNWLLLQKLSIQAGGTFSFSRFLIAKVKNFQSKINHKNCIFLVSYIFLQTREKISKMIRPVKQQIAYQIRDLRHF